jgi:hypothetical protein
VLWERHAQLRSIELGSDLDKAALDELFALTDEVLGRELRALKRRARDDHRSSSRWIYGATGALVVGSGVALTLGLMLGWLSGWGVTAIVISIAVGLTLAGAHAIAGADGHQTRVQAAVLALIAGAALEALAACRLSWWISVTVLVFLLGAAGAFIATVRIKPPDSPGDER